MSQVGGDPRDMRTACFGLIFLLGMYICFSMLSELIVYSIPEKMLHELIYVIFLLPATVFVLCSIGWFLNSVVMYGCGEEAKLMIPSTTCSPGEDKWPSVDFVTCILVCPICSVKVARNMLSHITLQHGHLFKLQRRRRLRRVAVPSSQALSLLGRDLREAHLQVLLGGSGYRSNNTTSSVAITDPLLSSLVLNFPATEAEEISKTLASSLEDASPKCVPLQRTWKSRPCVQKLLLAYLKLVASYRHSTRFATLVIFHSFLVVGILLRYTDRDVKDSLTLAFPVVVALFAVVLLDRSIKIMGIR